jgi:hypothetical protein
MGQVVSGVSQYGLGIANLALGMNSAGQEAQITGRIGQQNIRSAETAASDALYRGAQASGVSALKGGELQAAQKTGFAAAGVDVRSATAMDVMADSAAMTELDRATIRNNAQREAWGYEKQAAQFSLQGTLDRKRIEDKRMQTILGSAGQMISGVGSMAAGIGG